MEAFLGCAIDNCLGLLKLLLPKDHISWELLNIKNNENHYPSIQRTIETPVGTQYVVNVPDGLCIDDFRKKQPQIESMLRTKVKIELATNFKVIITEIKTKYQDCYTTDFKHLLPDMKFRMGKTLEGKELVLDLGGTECHTGVFGSTGSGKSVFLNVLVTQMILKDIQLRIIDLKGGVEFGIYRRYKYLSYFAVTPTDAETLLIDTVNLMNKRYKQLFDQEAKSYKDIKNMKPVVVLIDEFSVLDKKDNKAAYKALFELLSRGRACNICVIICTQRPSHEVLPGTIKCNLKNFITFKLETEIDSEIALCEKGNKSAFTDLQSPGEGLLKCNGKIKGFKSYYLDDNTIKSLIQDKLTYKKPILPTERNQQKNNDKTAFEELN